MDNYDNFRQYENAAKQTNKSFWNNIDGYEIPYNQRNYEWDEKNIEEFIQDLKEAYDDKKFLTYGTFYMLKEYINSSITRTTIWDGQQRVITSFLLFSAIKNFLNNKLENLNNKDIIKNFKNITGRIENYLFKKDFQLKDEERRISDKDKCHIPKLFSVYETDNKLLRLISNGKIKDISICYKRDKDNKYSCDNCDKYSEKIKHTTVINHLLEDCNGSKYKDILKIYKNHKDIEPNNNMILAYNKFMNFLQEQYDEVIDTENSDELDNLYQFIIMFEDKIPHEDYICKTVESASRIFELLNSRGKKLNNESLIRHIAIRDLDKKDQKDGFKKIEEILKFCKEDNDCKRITKNYENIIRILFSLSDKKYTEDDDIIKSCNRLMTDHKEDYFQIIEKNKQILKEILSFIENNKWGIIIFNDFIWEIFEYIIIPFYIRMKNKNIKEKKKSKYFTQLLEILISYQIRTLIKQRTIYNSKTKLIENTNNILDNNDKTIKNILLDIKKIVIDNLLKDTSDFLGVCINKKMTLQQAKKLLLYYELKKQNDNVIITHNTFDIEHIMPKNTKNKDIDKIGNLTLFESENSGNGHKGNRSLQDLDFNEKKEYYEKSVFKITQNIVKDYDTWNDKNIIKRTEKIIKFIDEKTNDCLENDNE